MSGAIPHCPIVRLERQTRAPQHKEKERRATACVCLGACACVCLKIATGAVRAAHTPPACLKKTSLSVPWTEAALPAAHSHRGEVAGCQAHSQVSWRRWWSDTLPLPPAPCLQLISILSTRTQRTTWWIFRVSVHRWLTTRGRPTRVLPYVLQKPSRSRTDFTWLSRG